MTAWGRKGKVWPQMPGDLGPGEENLQEIVVSTYLECDMERDEILRLTRGIALTSITPFNADGSIDDKGIHQLVEFLIENGLNRENGFLVPLSTTGNFLALSLEERKRVVEVFMDAVSDRLPVVVGCNHIRLSDSIELAEFSQAHGALGIMVCPPFYWKATEAQIIDHFHQICKSVDIGVIIYNNHWASQVDLSVMTIGEILKNPNVVGLKESTYSVMKLIEVNRRFADRINILNGLGEAYEPAYRQLGCQGFTSTLGNVIPEISVKLYSLIVKEEFNEAKSLADRVASLSNFMDSLSGGQYIAGLKYVLEQKGICKSTVRAPILSLTKDEMKRLDALIEGLKP